MTVKRYDIDYEYGSAEFWTPAGDDKALGRFEALASQCFGIRKSIGATKITGVREEGIPSPWCKLEGAYEMLRHSGGDTIVWDADGEKVKSEWDQ